MIISKIAFVAWVGLSACFLVGLCCGADHIANVFTPHLGKLFIAGSVALATAIVTLRD